MKTLFEYAVVYNPNKDAEKAGKTAVILIQPTTILAKDAQEVNMRAVRAIPEQYADRLADIHIAVRPF